IDPSLKHLVEKLLPLSTYYQSINAFVDNYSRFEYGTINHALCAAIRVFLKEYLLFIAQLEHQFETSTSFTLQQLWFFSQDTLQNMRILHNLATTIRKIKRDMNDSMEGEDSFEAVFKKLNQEDTSEEVQIPENQKGGAILNILVGKLTSFSGDPNSKKIYTFLLSKASVPYFDILNSWIYRGEIIDPYNEFMVIEKGNVKKENLEEDFNDAYWEMRYTIRKDSLPIFLEPLKNQILLAGKYLNVVRECGVSIANPEEMQNELLENDPDYSSRRHDYTNSGYTSTRGEVWAAIDGSRFVKNLEVAYKYANHTLLRLLLKDQQLLGRLRSLKHYFLLDQSDFLTSFLDLAKDELKRPAIEISQTRLQSLMDLVLRNPSSVSAYDPFKEDVKVSMSNLKLIDQLLRINNVAGMDGVMRDSRLEGMISEHGRSERSPSLSTSVSSQPREILSGYDALILDYTVTFPLSLVISRKALTKYQLLFRQILTIKHVEDLLCGAWKDQKEYLWKKTSKNAEIERWKYRIFSLRNRMLAFIQQFAYYITNEVLEPNWHKLEMNLNHISTVDQVLQYHSDYLDSCLKECMLTNSKLLRVMEKGC
ncbi:gamma-tubulin complex component protein, partial [Pilobolus umbonatus]